MLMQHYKGIVLKRYMPKKQKISLLDYRLGRIEAVVRDAQLGERSWPGMVLAYTVQESPSIYFLEQATIVAAPFESARCNIGFLHHLLELCYYFLPLGHPEPEIFQLIIFVSSQHQLLDAQTQLIVCAKFFWLVGLEIDMLRHQNHIQDLLALPLQSMLKEQGNIKIYQMLTEWLSNCIHAHPQRASFKTMTFLPGNGAS